MAYTKNSRFPEWLYTKNSRFPERYCQALHLTDVLRLVGTNEGTEVFVGEYRLGIVWKDDYNRWTAQTPFGHETPPADNIQNAITLLLINYIVSVEPAPAFGR